MGYSFLAGAGAGAGGAALGGISVLYFITSYKHNYCDSEIDNSSFWSLYRTNNRSINKLNRINNTHIYLYKYTFDIRNGFLMVLKQV